METVVLPYPPPPRHVPPYLGRTPVGGTLGRSAGLFKHLVGLSLFVLPPVTLAAVALSLLLYWDLSVYMQAAGFIVSATLAIVYLKSFLPRRVPLPPAVIPVTRDAQPIAYAFIAQVAADIGSPAPRKLWVGSGVELRLSARRSFLDLVRIGRWDIQIGLWLWDGLTLSEFQALVARTLAPLTRGRFDRWRFAVRGLLQAMIVGDDFLDEMAESGNAFAGLARLARGFHGRLVHPLRWVAAILLRIGRQQDDALSDDLTAVRISGSDSLVHAILRADFAGASLNELDDVLEKAADAGFFTSDLYAHSADASKAVWVAHNDFTLGQTPTLRGPNAGKYADVFEPGQAYFSTMWKNFPDPGEREQNAKKTFVASERDERPATYLLEDVSRLRERLARLRYVELMGADDDYIPLADTVVTLWLESHDQEAIPARYSGCYDDARPLQPGTPAELDAALRAEAWEDGRLLSTANGLYLRAGERAARWLAATTALAKVQKRTVFRPTGRDRALAEDLEDGIRKLTRWLTALDRWAYVAHVHMAARLPTLELHEAVMHRYESVLRFQVFANDPKEYRNRVESFVRKLESYPDGGPYRLARDARHEFKASQKDFELLLQEAAAIDDPLLKQWTGDLGLDQFLYARRNLPSKHRNRPLAAGRRLLHAWDEVLGKARWLHIRSVTALLAIHQQIVEQFMTQAVAYVAAVEELPEAVALDFPEAIALQPVEEVVETAVDLDPDVLELAVEEDAPPAKPQDEPEDAWGPR